MRKSKGAPRRYVLATSFGAALAFGAGVSVEYAPTWAVAALSVSAGARR